MLKRVLMSCMLPAALKAAQQVVAAKC